MLCDGASNGQVEKQVAHVYDWEWTPVLSAIQVKKEADHAEWKTRVLSLFWLHKVEGVVRTRLAVRREGAFMSNIQREVSLIVSAGGSRLHSAEMTPTSILGSEYCRKAAEREGFTRSLRTGVDRLRELNAIRSGRTGDQPKQPGYRQAINRCEECQEASQNRQTGSVATRARLFGGCGISPCIQLG